MPDSPKPFRIDFDKFITGISKGRLQAEDEHISIKYLRSVIASGNFNKADLIVKMIQSRNSMVLEQMLTNSLLFRLENKPDHSEFEAMKKYLFMLLNGINWIDQHLFEMGAGKPVSLKDHHAAPTEKQSFFKNRFQVLTLFDALRELGIIPKETEQTQLSFFISNAYGYTDQKTQQAFSENRNLEKVKQRENARAVIEALQMTITYLKQHYQLPE